MASLHENIGQKTSFACHDVPLHGHVTTSVMSTAGLASAPEHVNDVRMTKATDGYMIHLAEDGRGLRQFNSAVWGPSLYADPKKPLSGQCNVLNIKRSSTDAPITVHLDNGLQERLNAYYKGECGEGKVCEWVNKMFRGHSMDFNKCVLLSLSPLTSEKRVVFSTQNTQPVQSLVGAMCTPEQSLYMKNVFLDLAQTYWSGIYEVPLPRMDPQLLNLLNIDPKQKRPLWLTQCNKGMFICDKKNNQMRLLAICKSRDFPGNYVDESDNGNVQVYSLPPCGGQMEFYVCKTPAQCERSTPTEIFIPSSGSVQLALMIIRNAFANQNTVANNHHSFAEITRVTDGHPSVKRIITCATNADAEEYDDDVDPADCDAF